MDLNLSLGISHEKGVKDFYTWGHSVFNTFSEQKCKEYLATGKVVSEPTVYQIENITLLELFNNYLPKGQKIDFLNIDAEGYDFEILSTNDWNVYRPELVVVEIHDVSIDNIKENRIYQLLAKNQYSVYSMLSPAVIFVNDRC